MKMRDLLVSIALVFLFGCSHRNSDPRVKDKVLTRPDQPVSETTKNEGLAGEGESVTRLDSGGEYRGPANPENPNPSLIKLKSGKEVKVRAAGKIYLAQGEPGWMFQYETSLKIDDVPALEKEAEEIWPLLEKNINKDGYKFAVLSANEPQKRKTESSFISNNRAYNFVFEKSESGKWVLRKSKDKAEKTESP